MLVNKFILAIILVDFVLGCDITVRVISESNKPYYVQVQTPNGKKSAMKLLKSIGDVMTYRFIDTCAGSTKINSYQSKDSKKHVFQNAAKLDGNGQIDYKLTQQGSIHIQNRIGITCAFSDCDD